MKKALVRWGRVVAVLAVACLVLTADSGVPFLPARPPSTSDSSPLGSPTGGPLVDAAVLSRVRVDLVDPEGYDLSTEGYDYLEGYDFGSQAGPEGFVTGGGSDLRSEPDEPAFLAQGTLASVLLGLMVLRAVRGRDRDRRQPAAATTSAA